MRAILPLAALALASAACASRPVETSSPSPTPSPTTTSAAGGTTASAGMSGMSGTSGSADMSAMAHYSATLASVGASPIHGTAMIHSMNGKQTVEVQLSGATSGATLPWHIHSGTCAEAMGPIVGSPSLYAPITASSDGTASVMADVPVTLSAGQHYHVNVHASPSDMGTIVACGDLHS